MTELERAKALRHDGAECVRDAMNDQLNLVNLVAMSARLALNDVRELRRQVGWWVYHGAEPSVYALELWEHQLGNVYDELRLVMQRIDSSEEA